MQGTAGSRRRSVSPSDSDGSNYDDDKSSTATASVRRTLFSFPPPNTASSSQTPVSLVSASSLAFADGSDPGVAWSSPIIGNKTARKAKSITKAQKKKKATEETRKAAAAAEAKAQLEAEQEEQDRAAIEAELAKQRVLEGALDSLKAGGLSWSDAMTYVFDPTYMQGVHRWDGFFKKPGTASKILDLWVSPRNSDSARAEVHEWAVSYVEKTVNRSAQALNQSGVLRSPKQYLNSTNILGFSMPSLHDIVDETAGVAMRIFRAFATPTRHLHPGEISAARLKKKTTVRHFGSLLSCIRVDFNESDVDNHNCCTYLAGRVQPEQ